MKKILFVFGLVFLMSCGDESIDTVDVSTGDGKAGSLATFILKGSYLYTVDDQKLNTFLIADEYQENPNFTDAVNVGFGIETLFNFQNNLFIGSNSAMYIYNIHNPERPEFESISTHFRACDPVVANQLNAFVTIREGASCGGGINQLKVYDIVDVKNPILLLDKTLVEPKGMALYDKYIFVADTAIRIFDVSNVENGEINFVAKIDQYVNDLIIRDHHLYAIGDFGMYQYELKNNNDELEVKEISELNF